MNNGKFPLVSIGVPVFNGGEYLFECLNSIKNQTFTDWECVIVNNCSTDNSVEIAKAFTKTDHRFVLLNYDDYAQIVQNWNRIIPNISNNTRYLKVVQADDWIFPQSLELMVALMEEYPNVGVCSSYRIDGCIVNCDGLDINKGPVYKGKELLIRHLNDEIDISGATSTPLFRISDLKKLDTFPNIYNEEEYHVDTRLFYEMMHLADVGFVFQVLNYTRIHDSAETVKLCHKVNTYLNGREQRLFRFKEFFPQLEKAYTEHRKKYAYFLLKERIKGRKDSILWHKKFLKRKITFMEYLRGLIELNGLTTRLLGLFKKKRKVTTIKINTPY